MPHNLLYNETFDVCFLGCSAEETLCSPKCNPPTVLLRTDTELHHSTGNNQSFINLIHSVCGPAVALCVCTITGTIRGQSDASPEVHQSLEESSPAATVCPAGLHEDFGESWTSAHIQTERRLDWALQVQV